MNEINWEQLGAQIGVVAAGVAAVTYLVRNAMATYWTKLELQGSKLAEFERRFNEIDRRNEKGDLIHEEHADRITRAEEISKSAHQRLDRAGG